MESCKENSECLRENPKKTRVLRPQFPQNMGLFLERVFRLLPGVVDGSEFTSDFSSFLALGIQLNVYNILYASVEKHVFAMCVLSL